MAQVRTHAVLVRDACSLPNSPIPRNLRTHSTSTSQPAASGALNVGQLDTVVYGQCADHAAVCDGTPSQRKRPPATGTCRGAGHVRRSCATGLRRLVLQHDAQSDRRTAVAHGLLPRRQVSQTLIARNLAYMPSEWQTIDTT